MKRIACLTILVTLAALAISRSTPASTGKGGREVPSFIIDTDMDNDDAAAIAYMCQEHLLGHVRLLGVTITRRYELRADARIVQTAPEGQSPDRSRPLRRSVGRRPGCRRLRP